MNVASRAPQMKRDWLDWPFFGESHRAFAGALDRFVGSGAISAIDHGDIYASCRQLARSLADGPYFAHGMTKTMLNQEWAMGLDELIESEAQAQTLCMTTQDFRRAFEAFAAKRKPVFEGD